RHTRSKRDWSSDVCSSDLHFHHARRHYRLVINRSAIPGPDLRPLRRANSSCVQRWKRSLFCCTKQRVAQNLEIREVPSTRKQQGPLIRSRPLFREKSWSRGNLVTIQEL